jgi:hypothetical protein
MMNTGSALAAALNELAVVGSDQDRERITALRDRLEAARLRVLVAGEAKRGTERSAAGFPASRAVAAPASTCGARPSA